MPARCCFFCRCAALAHDEAALALKNPAKALSSVLCSRNEIAAWQFLYVRLSRLLTGYGTTIEHDERLLAGAEAKAKEGKESKESKDLPVDNVLMAVRVRLGEKRLIARTLDEVKIQLARLGGELPDIAAEPAAADAKTKDKGKGKGKAKESKDSAGKQAAQAAGAGAGKGEAPKAETKGAASETKQTSDAAKKKAKKAAAKKKKKAESGARPAAASEGDKAAAAVVASESEPKKA